MVTEEQDIILTHLIGWEAVLSFFCVSALQWCQPKQVYLAYSEEHQSRCFSEFQLQLAKLFPASFQTQPIALTQLQQIVLLEQPTQCQEGFLGPCLTVGPEHKL